MACLILLLLNIFIAWIIILKNLLAVILLVLAAIFLLLKPICHRISEGYFGNNPKDPAKGFWHGLSFIALVVWGLFYITMAVALIIINVESGLNTESGEPERYFNVTNVTTTSNIVDSLMDNPSVNIPTFIAVVGGVVVFFFFYGILGKNPNIETNTEKRELMYSYAYEYMAPLGVVLCFAIISFHLIGDNDKHLTVISETISALTKGTLFELVIIAVAIALVCILAAYVRSYTSQIKEYSQIEMFNRILNSPIDDKCHRSAKSWKDHIINQFKEGNVLSAYIFVIIAVVAFLSYHFRFNIFSLVFFEIVLISFHLTVSRISHTPRQKYTISLHTGEQLYHVYILKERLDSIEILQPDNTKVKIFKGSIMRIDEESRVFS